MRRDYRILPSAPNSAPIAHVWNDGGRAAAGFKGTTGDCVVRAIAIATQRPYKAVYDEFKTLLGIGNSPREGILPEMYKAYLLAAGWHWQPTMYIGKGCQVHLHPSELPSGILIVRLSRHLTTMLNGVIHDTHNPARGGKRCVYGYFYQ